MHLLEYHKCPNMSGMQHDLKVYTDMDKHHKLFLSTIEFIIGNELLFVPVLNTKPQTSS